MSSCPSPPRGPRVPVGERLLGDSWLRGWAVVGGVLVAVSAIVGLPWTLWFAWVYVGLLSVLEVVRGQPRAPHPSDT